MEAQIVPCLPVSRVPGKRYKLISDNLFMVFLVFVVCVLIVMSVIMVMCTLAKRSSAQFARQSGLVLIHCSLGIANT